MKPPTIIQEAMRVLAQAEHLLTQAFITRISFADYVGPHMRHIIEHFEPLLNQQTEIDYDNRARDMAVQTDVHTALTRLQWIQSYLSQCNPTDLNRVVTVKLRCGDSGAQVSQCQSTLGRELMFASSHAIHHYALIKIHCATQGIPLNDAFGVAPATLSFQQTQFMSTTPESRI